MLAFFQQMDGGLLLAIQGMRLEALNPLVKGFTALGNAGLLWLLLSVLLLCRKSTRRAGALALGALALGFLCTNLTIKPLVHRPRPWLALAELVPLIHEGDPHSFPSGHATAAFAAGMVWARELPRKGLRVLAAAMAVCMALSRLYVGVHYPSDVVCGAAVGALCAWVVRTVWRRFEARGKLHQ